MDRTSGPCRVKAALLSMSNTLSSELPQPGWGAREGWSFRGCGELLHRGYPGPHSMQSGSGAVPVAVFAWGRSSTSYNQSNGAAESPDDSGARLTKPATPARREEKAKGTSAFCVCPGICSLAVAQSSCVTDQMGRPAILSAATARCRVTMAASCMVSRLSPSRRVRMRNGLRLVARWMRVTSSSAASFGSG